VEAIVLAGGLGTRLRSVVADVPKPMASIDGRPFMEYLLDHCIDQGIESFTLSVGYRHAVITSHFGVRYRGRPVRYAIEESPLGTGGALLNALDAFRFDTPVFVLNGDTYFAVDFGRLDEFAVVNEAQVAFSLFETKDTVRYTALDVDARGRIVRFQAASGPRHLANGGVYWLNPVAFAAKRGFGEEPRSLEVNLLPELLVAGTRLYGLVFSDPFIDIGVPEDYRRAQTWLPSLRKARHESA
jgi:D-glycero-alpha-D-manno-heptose 1-phosphate guanylyltransferase